MRASACSRRSRQDSCVIGPGSPVIALGFGGQFADVDGLAFGWITPSGSTKSFGGATMRWRQMPAIVSSTTGTATMVATPLSGWYIVTNAHDREPDPRKAMSTPAFSVNRPNIAKVMPQVAMITSTVAATCGQPVVVTISERVKTANVISVIGMQIFSASHIVRMNEASAMRDAIAAVSDVGGDSSPHTDSRNTKKCAAQGSMPSSRNGPTMTTAPIT
jgi:hypothetical protein